MVSKSEQDSIKKKLFKKLLDENRFWSYDMAGVETINDDMLILKTLIHLDMADIDLLFLIYPSGKIKKVWREQLAIQGDYYRSLNLFLAWFYFGIKKPSSYLKMIETKRLNSFAQ
ncbi:MAG: hypothetical protein LBU44_07135 [Mediterranea sp.]|jgi:hypothetical protein|nr:hypothetical protein [Mediterranea sp.]